jgi:hypothetical protein
MRCLFALRDTVHVAAASAGHFRLRLRYVLQIRQDRTVFHSHMAKDRKGISLPAVVGTPVSAPADSAGTPATHRLIRKCMASVNSQNPLCHPLHADVSRLIQISTVMPQQRTRVSDLPLRNHIRERVQEPNRGCRQIIRYEAHFSFYLEKGQLSIKRRS